MKVNISQLLWCNYTILKGYTQLNRNLQYEFGYDIKPEYIYNIDGEFEVSNEDVKREKLGLID